MRNLRKPDFTVLRALRKAKRCGITFDHFYRGFRLSAYIYNLRQHGFEIMRTMEQIGKNRNVARYVLVKEPK